MTGVIRKVKDGRVKIDNIVYEPDAVHDEYDGSLDGYKFYFIPYPHYGGNPEPHLLALWGSEAEHDLFKEANKLRYSEDELMTKWDQLPSAINVRDGVIFWYFWKEVV